MKKLLIVTLMAVLWMGSSGPAPGMGSTSTRPTLLVMPARYTTMQLAFDLIEKRDTVLVSYQSESGGAAPVLHVWDRQEWIPVSLDSYRQLSFLRTTPSRIILVGDDATLPASLVDASTMSGGSKVMQVPSQDTATLVNALGKVYEFNDQEWAWFSGRYRLELNDANTELRGQSFYDQPAPVAGRPESPWNRPVVRSQRKSQVISSPTAVKTMETTTVTTSEIAPLGTLSVAPMDETVPSTGGSSLNGMAGSIPAPVIWTEDAPIK